MEDPTSGSPYDALRISGRVVYPIRSSPDAPRTFTITRSFDRMLSFTIRGDRG
jgi:hypothetical protein